MAKEWIVNCSSFVVSGRSGGDDMATRFALKTSACLEYEGLLLASKTAFNDFKVRREELQEAGRSYEEAIASLAQLRADYQEAYARLIHHFDDCQLCEYMSRLPVKSQTSSASIIPFQRRSA
jgi:hypothetical protein